MNVIEQTTHLPQSAHPSDFNFARLVIDELTRMPNKEKVHFPVPGNSSVFADIECKLGYNDDDKPYAEFFFRTLRHELEMAHSAVVHYTVVGDSLHFQLQIRPNKRLRSNGHKPMNSVHDNAKKVALAICRNYAPGTVGRKVIPVDEKQKKAA